MNRYAAPRHLLVVGLLFASSLLIAAGCPEPGREAASTDGDKSQAAKSAGESSTQTEREPVAEVDSERVAESPTQPPREPDGNTEQSDDAGPQAPQDGDQKVEPKEKHHTQLFKDWPEPQYVVVVSGRQHGYIEPCGCAGLEHQKGGLARRHSFVRQLVEDKGWKVAKLDVGNQIRRFGVQATRKFGKAVEGLNIIGYDAVGFGPDDLRLGLDLLPYLNQDLFVVANATVFDKGLTLPYKVITVGDQRIGVTAVFGDEHQNKLDIEEIKFTKAEEGLAEVWPKLADENCDLYVLLAHTSLENSTKLAKAFPKFDLVVTAGGATEPNYLAEPIPDTDAVMVEVGEKGMYVGVIGLFDDDDQPLRFQKVPLDDRFADSPEMLGLMKDYQDLLQSLGLKGLEVLSRSHPTGRPHPTGRTFAGSLACKKCHETQYDIWKNGLDGLPGYHAHATVSLTNPPNDRSHIPRHYDPECLSCHVTGWNPQKFYPYETGYLKLSDELLHTNGCENCHGPGAEHIKLAEALDAGEIQLTRQEKVQQLYLPMRLSLDDAETKCYECHDLDNSPDFDFDEYWSRIEHYY